MYKFSKKTPRHEGKKKKKLNKKILLIIIPVLVVVLGTAVSFASVTKTYTVSHERLDTGVVFVWEDSSGGWQNSLYPGGPCDRSFSLYVGSGDYENFAVTTYNGSNFSFSDEDICHWNKTNMADNKSSYDRSYMPYAADYNNATISYGSGTIKIKNSCTLSSADTFDVADKVRKGQQSDVYAYLGDNIPSGISTPMNKMLTDPDIKGCLYFCPLVITYDEVISYQVYGWEVFLDVPDKVKVGDGFTVNTGVEFENPAEFKSKKVEYTVDGGETWTEVEGTDPTKMTETIDVMTRKDPDREGYFEISHDGGKTWVDGGKMAEE